MSGLTLLANADIGNAGLAECDAGLHLTAVTLAAAGICTWREADCGILGRSLLLTACNCQSLIDCTLYRIRLICGACNAVNIG